MAKKVGLSRKRIRVYDQLKEKTHLWRQRGSMYLDYDKCEAEAAASIEKYYDDPAVTDALNMKLSNSDDKTDYALWEKSTAEFLGKNADMIQKWAASNE